MTSGYSGTPLAKKLGIKAGSTMFVSGAPESYPKLLAPLPSSVTFARKVTDAVDLVHLFVTRRSKLQSSLAVYRAAIRPDATIWTSWPKKSSKMPTDITEDTIREVALPLGLVDVKVCAIDDVWSGLKLVVRKELR